MNLIGNAVKFTASGSITIAVEQINQEQLQFIIRDTGIGIAKDKLEHIFESFNQADTSTSRKYGGTGLGTTISKRLVELMGGKIWLESDEGVGTTFYFTVNVRETKQKIKKVELLNIDSSLLKTERPLNVLAAEDGEQNAELLKIRLEALGHNFIRAVNGLEAVNLCSENNHFDIILMDVQMPIMDGLQATEEIRLLPSGKDIPIIALTASVMHEDRKACFAAGMDGFVKKPIVFNELFTEMAKLLPQHFEGAPKEALEVQPELPDVPYINFQKGVNTWACADVYTKNLKQFARLHHSDMNALQRHIENSDVDMAEQLIHALKGTAGNLALVDLYDELLIMHGYLKRRNITAAHEHIDILTNTFEESLLSINNLHINKQLNSNAEALDMPTLIEQINVQITRLSNGEFDEEQIGALLHQLTFLNCSEEEINRLRTSIDNFDFDLAVQVLTDILPNSE
jgi:CheY-like chemotaxis protein